MDGILQPKLSCIQLAPESVVDLNRCSCDKSRCSTARCTCCQNNLPCTEICKCEKGNDCENVSTIVFEYDMRKTRFL